MTHLKLGRQNLKLNLQLDSGIASGEGLIPCPGPPPRLSPTIEKSF